MPPKETTHTQAAGPVDPCEDCDIPQRVTRLEQAVFGDKTIGLPGILPTLEGVGRDVKTLLEKDARMRWVLIGVGVGLALNSGIGLLTLVKVFSAAVGVPTP